MRDNAKSGALTEVTFYILLSLYLSFILFCFSFAHLTFYYKKGVIPY